MNNICAFDFLVLMWYRTTRFEIINH